MRDPATGEVRNLTHYYGAWVTPYDESVQDCMRAAASLCDPPQLWGYQSSEESVTQQVRAIFNALKQRGVVYVNSVLDYGAPPRTSIQHTRMPIESLRSQSANCIDGTVLMASLLEGISLNPAIVLVPGHALVGWQVWEGKEQWSYLETTMIATSSFEDASRTGIELVARYRARDEELVVQHALSDLRARGIWPIG